MRISIELSEDAGTMRPAAQPSAASTPASVSGGSAPETAGTGQGERFGWAYAPAPPSIATEALSASAIDAGPPPRELIDRAEVTSARSPTTAAGADDRTGDA